MLVFILYLSVRCDSAAGSQLGRFEKSIAAAHQRFGPTLISTFCQPFSRKLSHQLQKEFIISAKTQLTGFMHEI